MEQPTLMYTAYTYENRLVITARWETIFIARKCTSLMLKHLAAHGYKSRVWHWGVHERSGEYEVDVILEPDLDSSKVIEALYTKPPFSNRGVT